MSGKTDINGKNPLAEGKISSLMLRFAMTTLAALVLNSVYNLTDTLFVSRGVGDYAMGGVSVAFPFVMIQGAISTAIGGGAAVLVSKRLGERDPSAAGKVTLNAMIVFYTTAVIISILGLCLLDPLLQIMGVTADIYEYSREYFSIILIGNVFSTGFSSIIRAEGRMLYGLLIWVIPISINIILDAVFVLALGWGVKGSAAATVICQFISFVMSVIFFTKFSVQSFKGARPSASTAGAIFSTGLPSLIQIGSLSAIMLLFNNIIRDISGTDGINAFAYAGKIITYAVVPLTAITQALAPVAGFNLGAGNSARARSALRIAAAMSFVYSAIAIIAAQTMPHLLIRIFTDSETYINLGARCLRILSVSMLFAPYPMIIGTFYQSAGKRLLPLMLYASTLCFALPLAFTMPRALGADGIWWSYAAASAASALMAFAAYAVKRCPEQARQTSDQ